MAEFTGTAKADSSGSTGAKSVTRPVGIEWLCLLCGLFFLFQYSWLIDDAFVYFRYVDNLLYAGRGLVFNAGEYVEGFSSPLWTLMLIALRSTGLDYWFLIRAVGVVAFVVAWYLLVLVNRRMSPNGSAILNVPLCYLAFNYAVMCYFTSGLETPWVQVSGILYALFVLHPGSRSLQVAMGFTPILRHELAVPFALCVVWSWVRERRVPWMLVLSGATITGGWELFRITYYADLFPNTFYLKNVQDVPQGLTYVQDTARAYWLYPFLVANMLIGLFVRYKDRAGAAGGRRKNRGDDSVCETKAGTDLRSVPAADGEKLRVPARLMMLALAVSVTAYVVKIGGDPRHYRYLAFPFCLIACSGAGLVEQWMRVGGVRPIAGTMFLLGLVLAIVTASFHPRQLSRHPIFGIKKGEKLEAVHTQIDMINDAWMHRYDPTLAQRPWGAGKNIEFKDAYRKCAIGRALHTSVSHGAWCVFLYKRPDIRVIHTLGLTDPILARVDIEPDRPGHKLGLFPLAADLEKLIRAANNDPSVGMFRKAIASGRAPRWVADNLDTIEVIEKKMFNQHVFGENLGLALTFPGKIDPGDRIERWHQTVERQKQRQTNQP